MTIKWEARSYSREEFTDAWNRAADLPEVCRLLGLSTANGARMRETAQALSLDDKPAGKRGRPPGPECPYCRRPR